MELSKAIETADESECRGSLRAKAESGFLLRGGGLTDECYWRFECLTRTHIQTRAGAHGIAGPSVAVQDTHNRDMAVRNVRVPQGHGRVAAVDASSQRTAVRPLPRERSRERLASLHDGEGDRATRDMNPPGIRTTVASDPDS